MKKIQVRMNYDQSKFVEAYLLDSNKNAINVDVCMVWIAGVKPLDKIGKFYFRRLSSSPTEREHQELSSTNAFLNSNNEFRRN